MKILTLRIYRDKRMDLRWVLIAANGRKLANGAGDGYGRRRDLARDIWLTFMPQCLPAGADPVRTLLAFRNDIRLEDLVMPGTTKSRRMTKGAEEEA